MSFRLGEVLDPHTKLFMVIHGDSGDTEKIYLTPEGGRLEPGKLYTVNVRTTDVGKVRTIGACQGRGGWGLKIIVNVHSVIEFWASCRFFMYLSYQVMLREGKKNNRSGM